MSYQTKTQPTLQNVTDFLKNSCETQKLADCIILMELMEKLTGKKAVLWGSSIIGFGKYNYQYATGHSGEAAAIGFSPRKSNITLYITTGFGQYMDEGDTVKNLMAQLGTYKTGKICLYIKKLADIDLEILTKIIGHSLQYLKENYQTDL